MTKIEQAKEALASLSLTSHELIKMLGVIHELYETTLKSEADDFRRAMSFNG